METTPADKQLELKSLELVNSVLDGAHNMLTCLSKSERKQSDWNIDWVTSKDFTVELGEKLIKDYMGTWEMHPSWMCSTEFIQETELDFQKQYHYKAQWSIPTYRNPIPKSTASVYFVIILSKIRPQTQPVDVHYQIESNRTIHVPGKTRFREKWLKDVIESKALLQDSVTF
ncbi:A-kinase anchor protein 14 [Brachyhypopomus gauderio]|uniref:A-kinase anchor protein 14 n=1 Tax=Brachyhypopomus gauderio TaxID=698409 RepID=UPI004041220D